MPDPWHLIEAGVATAPRYAGMTEAPEALAPAVAAIASPAKRVRIPFVPRDAWLRAAKDACRALFDAVAAAYAGGARPLVVGGECSVVAGSVPAAHSVDQELVLVYLDAHGDFNTAATTPSHFVGGMCLAHVCGHQIGTLLWPGVRPFPEDHVCLVGARDLDPGEVANLERSKVRRYSFDPAHPDADGLAQMLRRRRLWVHVDLDVVDPGEMSAVNFPAPGGPSFAALGKLLMDLRRVATIRGAEVCAYDPRQDPDRKLPARIADALTPLLA